MKRILFKDFVTLQRGFDLPRSEMLDGPYPVFGSTSIIGWHEEFKIQCPGVVTGRSGSLGVVQYVEKNYWPHNTALWVKDFKGNLPRYVYYFLQTLGLEKYNAGVGVPTLNRNHLDNLEIDVHEKENQRKIAAILSAYDDLIENNTRRIKILEEMAQAIYREWFIEFRSPNVELRKATPEEQKLTGKDVFPKGWEIVKLGEIAEEKRRGVNPSEIDPDTPYFGLEHLPRNSIALSDWGFAKEVQSTKLEFQKREILFGKIRPYFHKVGVAPLDGVCSSDTIVIVPKQEEFFGLVLGCVSSEAFVNHATQTSQGTKMPRANWDVLVKYAVSKPDQQTLIAFNQLVGNIVDLIINTIFRKRNLRRTRDLLLPKLISGEIRIENVEVRMTK